MKSIFISGDDRFYAKSASGPYVKEYVNRKEIRKLLEVLEEFVKYGSSTRLEARGARILDEFNNGEPK